MRIDTDRTYLRRFEIGDHNDLYGLHADAEIMKHTRAGRPLSKKESLEKLKEIISDNKKDHPLAKWAAFLKEDGSFLGWFGYWPSEFGNGEPELGFMISRSKWGQGLATEVAEAILAHYDKPRVHALTSLDNLASQRVLEKLGFKLLNIDKSSKHFVKVKPN